MNSQRTLQITLFGNLGADPEPRLLKPRTVTREIYNIVTDEVESETYTHPEREIRVASLGVNFKDQNGNEMSRWQRLVDYQDFLATCEVGDRLRVRGWFRERNYKDKDGVLKSVRELILTDAEIQPKRSQSSDTDTDKPWTDPEPMDYDDDEIPF
jgi:single-stranded DNA-binding protein